MVTHTNLQVERRRYPFEGGGRGHDRPPLVRPKPCLMIDLAYFAHFGTAIAGISSFGPQGPGILLTIEIS